MPVLDFTQQWEAGGSPCLRIDETIKANPSADKRAWLVQDYIAELAEAKKPSWSMTAMKSRHEAGEPVEQIGAKPIGLGALRPPSINRSN